jgi:hypothetical protein
MRLQVVDGIDVPVESEAASGRWHVDAAPRRAKRIPDR